MTNSELWRLRRSVALHGFAVVVFAMLALSGAGAATQGVYGLAVPFIIAGLAGAVGAAMIAVTVWRGQRGVAGAEVREGEGVRVHPLPNGADVRINPLPDGADVRMNPLLGGATPTPGTARPATAATERSEAPQRTIRLAMAAAAVVVLIAGVMLAPRGMDHAFVIWVAALLAAALALFALLAGDRPRTAEQPSGAPGPH